MTGIQKTPNVFTRFYLPFYNLSNQNLNNFRGRIPFKVRSIVSPKYLTGILFHSFFYNQVCCPKPVTICIPGFRCASSLKCESKTSKKRKKIRECTECTADKGICKTCHLINGKEECTTVDERPYDCGQYDYN